MAPSSSNTPAPLPLAPNRAALSNRISLLLASQSSVLKSMNHSRSAPSDPATQQRQQQQQQQQRRRRHHALGDNSNNNDDDDTADFKTARPNEGVGYVPDSAAVDARRDDVLLRRRLLGKRGADDARRKKAAAESESEDDEGRTALGKRKRPRKAVPQEEGNETPTVEVLSLQAARGGAEADDISAVKTPVEAEAMEDQRATSASAEHDAIENTQPKKKRKKTKNKKNKAKVQGTDDA